MATEKEEIQTIPTDALAAQGSTSGKKQLQEKGKEYFSKLGKMSAAKRKKDKRFNRKYYQLLAYKAQEAKRAKKEGRAMRPIVMKKSPISQITNFLKRGEL